VKSQTELLYTNAKELIGDAYALAPNGATAAITGTLATAKDIVVNGVAKTEAELAAVKAEIAGKLKDIVEKAKAFYKSLEGALAHIEALDPLPLAGDANVAGSILQIVTRGVALEQAVTDLAKYGARAAIQAQQVAVNAANAARTAHLVRVQRLQVTDAVQTADQVTNAALQIATGIQATFSKKLKQLTDILNTVGDIAKLFHNAQQALDTLRDMTVKIEWQPKIGSYVLPDLNWTIFRPASQHALTLLLEARAKATPNKSAGVDISCRLDHFDLCLGPLDADQKPVVGLQFDHISFAMEAGKKPDVDVKINGIVFGGPLAFLETLRRIIPLDGFSDPPYLKVDVSGIHAGFSLSVPNIAVGIFSIENIAISAKLEIPFFSSGDSPAAALTFTFSFCDKDHPFIITVSLLGGGGYFVVSFTPKGLEMLEASICVGAQLAINLFEIAQGSISIMAGITFTIKEGDVSLTAFLRIHGELDILGIITISVDISVSITYDITHKMMVAEAKIKVDVSIVFFSINVELPFRKEFHSCNNDPTLRQLMPPGPDNIPSEFWNDYCDAYA
jgi:hypothetical protein